MIPESAIPYTMIIGGGPAACSIFTAADGKGRLDKFLERGVILVESGGKLGAGTLRNIDFPSNSTGKNFTTSFVPFHYFRSVMQGRNATRLSSRGENSPHLSKEVAPYLDGIGKRVKELLLASGGSVLLNTEFTCVNQQTDQNGGVVYTAHSSDGKEVSARNVIFATGAEEKMHPQLEQYEQKLIFSRDILSGDRVVEGGNIVVIGASHSGWAVTHKLLQAKSDANLTLIHRSPIRVFEPHNMNTENTYGGIKGISATLYQRVLCGEEPNVSLRSVKKVQDASDLLDRADFIVQGTGYATRVVPIFNVHGQIGPKVESDNQVAVDINARIIGYDNSIIPQTFGIGHGYALTLGTDTRADSIQAYRFYSANWIGNQLLV